MHGPETPAAVRPRAGTARDAPPCHPKAALDWVSVAAAKLAGELGFEPRQTESESVVLPLHHSPPKSLNLQRFFRKFRNRIRKFCKPGELQRPYSRADVRGLALVVDETKPLLAVCADLHLVANPHPMLDILAGHPMTATALARGLGYRSLSPCRTG